jgi:hypothetical protein
VCVAGTTGCASGVDHVAQVIGMVRQGVHAVVCLPSDLVAAQSPRDERGRAHGDRIELEAHTPRTLNQLESRNIQTSKTGSRSSNTPSNCSPRPADSSDCYTTNSSTPTCFHSWKARKAVARRTRCRRISQRSRHTWAACASAPGTWRGSTRQHDPIRPPSGAHPTQPAGRPHPHRPEGYRRREACALGDDSELRPAFRTAPTEDKCPANNMAGRSGHRFVWRHRTWR